VSFTTLQKIIVIEARIEHLQKKQKPKDNNNNKKGQRGKKQKKKKKGECGYKNYPPWMLKEPKGKYKDKTKVVNDKEWWWCPHHKCCTLHKADQCWDAEEPKKTNSDTDKAEKWGKQ